MSDDFEIHLKPLQQLIKAMKAKPPQLEVGILGSSARSKGSSNATIGAVHEFGAPARGIPQRSFLRIPISENLEKELASSGLLDKDTLAAVIKSGTMKPWLEKVGIAAEGVVDDAFQNEGPGWPKWKDPNYTNEGGSILHDTGQLRNSITSKVSD